MNRSLLLSLLALSLCGGCGTSRGGGGGGDDDDSAFDDDDTSDDDDSAPSVTCTGDYTVGPTDTAGDMAAIAGCTAITGYLFIEGTLLTNLDGLSNLTSVGGYLRIYGNDALTNLDGLSSLTSVGGDLLIGNNDVLCQDSVDAFIAACTIGGTVTTSGNNGTCP